MVAVDACRGGEGRRGVTVELVREAIPLRSGRTQIVDRCGAGPPLVWLHGIEWVSTGHPVVEALAARYEIVCPLAPGLEDLAELDAVDDVHELAIHYDDVFASLGLTGVPVVGHSFGAMVAAELAAQYPKRVGALVLLAPLGLWRDDEPVADMFAVRFTDLPSSLYADREVAERMTLPPGAQVDVEAHVRRTQALTAVAKFVWPIPDRGLRRRLYRITAPTLAMFGEADPIVPASYARDFAAGIAGARTEVVAGAGHMLPVERPVEVTAAIDAFLSG